MLIPTFLLMTAAVTSTPPEVAAEPTPEQLYSAARLPFAGMLKSQNLRQEFVERPDKTFLGTVHPTFDQERTSPALGKERYENLISPWDAVARRIGTIRGENGKITSMQAAFGIKDGEKSQYLVVSTVDSQSQPGVHACVAMITGVSESQPPGFSKPEFLRHRYGAISGCGLIKEVLGVVDETKERDANSIEEWGRLHYELSDKINKVLGIKTLRTRTALASSSDSDTIEKPGEGQP